MIQMPELVNRRTVPIRPGSDELIVELGESIIQYRVSLEIKDVIVVSEDLAGRPWLISKIHYGTEDYAYSLMFFNGYALAVTVNTGDQLLIPTRESIDRATRDINQGIVEIGQPNPNLSDNPASRANRSKLPVKDKARIEILRRLGGPDANNVPTLAPNQAESPAIQQSVIPGQIVLGADVSEARCKNPSELSITQTRTERIRKAVQNRLSND